MRTLKELQAEIEKLQKEEETLITLCAFIPEKGYSINYRESKIKDLVCTAF